MEDCSAVFSCKGRFIGTLFRFPSTVIIPYMIIHHMKRGFPFDSVPFILHE